jgi:hypothetical protein
VTGLRDGFDAQIVVELPDSEQHALAQAFGAESELLP